MGCVELSLSLPHHCNTPVAVADLMCVLWVTGGTAAAFRLSCLSAHSPLLPPPMGMTSLLCISCVLSPEGALVLILSSTGTEGTLQHSGPSAGLVGGGRADLSCTSSQAEVDCEVYTTPLNAGPRAMRQPSGAKPDTGV